MENDLNRILKDALAPVMEPSPMLNQKILNQIKEQTEMDKKERKYQIRFSVAAAVMVMIASLGSVTAYAAWQYLSPGNVAEKMRDVKLAEAFRQEQALLINETQSYGGYDVTLLGLISGKMLSEYSHYSGGEIRSDRTYAVVAIANADGTALPETWEDGYPECEFFTSPLIGGYNPAFYNIASMHGDYSEMSEDGILYRILTCDTVEIFADHDLYLCVTEGMFYNSAGYHYDSQTGEISRNEDYEGLNALFRLPLDASGADPEKAKAYIESLNMGNTKETPAALEVSQESKAPLDAPQDIVIHAAGVYTEGEDGADPLQLVLYAGQFVGNPYQWGGESLTEGTDASGFVKSVYAQCGVSLPHSAAEDREQGSEVEGLENAVPGDLICYDDPSHVAIYYGNGLIIHAEPKNGICIMDAAEYGDIVAIRRILSVE